MVAAQGKAEEQVKQAQHAIALSDDPRIERLFAVFDRYILNHLEFFGSHICALMLVICIRSS